jgi:hypothetical protein
LASQEEEFFMASITSDVFTTTVAKLWQLLRFQPALQLFEPNFTFRFVLPV